MFDPHMLICPIVEYIVPSNTTDPITEVRPVPHPWYVPRKSCARHMEVPLSRRWKSEVTQGDIDLCHFTGFHDKSELGDSAIKVCCRNDLISETKHQLGSIDRPESECYAPTGHHIIGIISETKKNVLESAHIKCLPCGPSPDEWRDSVVASLEERDIVFTKDSEDGTDIIRCSFADAPSTDRRIVSIDDTPSGMTTEGVVRYPFGQGVADRDDDHEIFEIEKNIGPPSTVIGALLAD